MVHKSTLYIDEKIIQYFLPKQNYYFNLNGPSMVLPPYQIFDYDFHDRVYDKLQFINFIVKELYKK